MILSWNYPWTSFLHEIQRFNSGHDITGIQRLKHYLNGNIKMWPVYHNNTGKRAICKVFSKTEEFTFCVQCGKRAYITDNGTLSGLSNMSKNSDMEQWNNHLQSILEKYSKKYKVNAIYFKNNNTYQIGVTMDRKKVPLTIAMARVLHMFIKFSQKLKLE